MNRIARILILAAGPVLGLLGGFVSAGTAQAHAPDASASRRGGYGDEGDGEIMHFRRSGRVARARP